MYGHKAQVLDIVASPTSTQQFLSAHAGDDGGRGCTLWNMQDLHSAVVMTLTSPLEALATFPDALAGNLRCVHASFTPASPFHSADFKRSHKDVIYSAGLLGVAAHAIESGGTREAAKGASHACCCNAMPFFHSTALTVAMKSVRTCSHVAADALHGDVVYVSLPPSAHNIFCCLHVLLFTTCPQSPFPNITRRLPRMRVCMP